MILIKQINIMYPDKLKIVHVRAWIANPQKVKIYRFRLAAFYRINVGAIALTFSELPVKCTKNILKRKHYAKNKL